MCLAWLLCLLHLLSNSIEVIRLLRCDNSLSAYSSSNVDSNVTSVSAHYLNYWTSVMWLCCISDLIDHFHSRVHSCVITDSIFCAWNIVVYSTRQTDTWDTLCWKISRTSEWAVTTDNYDTVKAHFKTLISALLYALDISEFRTSCSIKTSTASLDYARNSSCIHLNNFTIKKTVISSEDTYDFHTLCKTSSAYCSDSSVHSRSISSAGKYTNFLSHVKYLQTRKQFILLLS